MTSSMSTPPRVLLILEGTPWAGLAAGPTLVAHALLKALTKVACCDVVVVVTDAEAEDPECLTSLRESFPTCEFCIAERRHGGLGLRYRRLLRALACSPVAPVRLLSPALVQAVHRRGSSGEYSLLILGSFNFAELVDVSGGTPTVIVPPDAYGLYALRIFLEVEGLAQRLAALWKVVAYTKWERRYYPLCRAVLPVSKVDSDWLRALHPRVKLGWINPAIAMPGPRSLEGSTGSRIRLVVSGVARLPGVRGDLIIALRRLELLIAGAQSSMEVLLWTHGPLARNDELRRRSEAMGVTLVEWVPDYEAFVHTIDVYLYPQKFCAGIQTKVIHACAAGSVVAARPQVLHPLDLVPNVSALPWDESGLAVHDLELVIRDPDRRARISDFGMLTIRSRYSSEQFLRSITDLIAETRASTQE